MEETKIVRIAIQKVGHDIIDQKAEFKVDSEEKYEFDKLRNGIRIDIPVDMELSEEEIKKVADMAENKIIDTLRSVQTTEYVERKKTV